MAKCILITHLYYCRLYVNFFNFKTRGIDSELVFLGRLSNKFHIYSPFGSAWMNISLWWYLDNTVLCQFVNISYVLVNWCLIKFYKFIWNHHLIKYIYHEIGLGVDLNFHSDSSQMSSVEFGSELCSSTPDQPIVIWTSLKRPCETRLLKH